MSAYPVFPSFCLKRLYQIFEKPQRIIPRFYIAALAVLAICLAASKQKGEVTAYEQ